VCNSAPLLLSWQQNREQETVTVTTVVPGLYKVCAAVFTSQSIGMTDIYKYMCVYICIYIYVYICIYIHIHIYAAVFTSQSIGMLCWIPDSIFICLLCICIYENVFIFLCIDIYIYIYCARLNEMFTYMCMFIHTFNVSILS
jgi:hypothetical protein